MNTGPHALDQALVLFGNHGAPSVFCRMDCNNPFGADADDHCAISLYDPERRAPQVDVVISAYAAYPQGDRYNICSALGGISGDERELRWRYFDPAEAPKQEMWNWSVDRQYPHEELPWVEETWSLDAEEERGAVGYTLRSMPSGPRRIYENLHDVLTNGGEPLIALGEVRRQVAVIEECRRQNPLPRLQ